MFTVVLLLEDNISVGFHNCGTALRQRMSTAMVVDTMIIMVAITSIATGGLTADTMVANGVTERGPRSISAKLNLKS